MLKRCRIVTLVFFLFFFCTIALVINLENSIENSFLGIFISILLIGGSVSCGIFVILYVAFLSNVIANLEDIYYIINRSFKIMLVNDTGKRLLVSKDEKVVGRSVLDFIYPEDKEEAKNAMEKAFRTGDPHDVELRLLGKDGKPYYFEQRGRTVKLPFLPFYYIVGVSRNVNRRRESEQNTLQALQALENTERKLHFAVESLPVLFLVLDKEMKVVSVNGAIQKLLGNNQDIVYQKIENIFVEGSRARVNLMNYLLQAITQGSIEGEISYENSFFLIHVEPFESGMILCIVDSTNTKKQEDVRLENKKTQAISQLVAGIAHNLNNMLTAVLGNSELVLSEMRSNPNANQRVIQKLQVVSSQSTRMAELVKGLLTFSQKHRSVKMTNFHLNSVLSETVEILESNVSPNISIKLETAAEDVYIEGSPSEVQNVLLNLGLNAAEAIPQKYEGEIVFSLSIEEVDTEKAKQLGLQREFFARIDVSDNGEGIPFEAQNRVFEPFFTTKDVGGMGMGLSTAIGTAKQHKGTLVFDSIPGKGTCFSFYLGNLEARPLEESKSPSSESRVIKQVRHKKPLVMVVDDETEILSMITDLLGKEYEVASFSDSLEALDYFRTNHARISVSILDIMMKGMNGVELFAEMQKASPKCKALFVSGWGIEQYPELSLNKGVLAFLQKPFDIQQLLSLISKTK